jgi:hypothetical protein
MTIPILVVIISILQDLRPYFRPYFRKHISDKLNNHEYILGSTKNVTPLKNSNLHRYK